MLGAWAACILIKAKLKRGITKFSFFVGRGAVPPSSGTGRAVWHFGQPKYIIRKEDVFCLVTWSSDLSSDTSKETVYI